MSRWLSAVALCAAASPALAQLPPDRALASMRPGEGLQVELFATEPMLLNPTSMDVDHRGRVWVAEAVNYRRLPPYNRPILRPEGDRVVVITDADGDGKADESTVFFQGKELYGPLSVCVIPQADGKALRVLVAQSPDILEFWDRDGDLKADGPPTQFLTNFGGFDHDHGVHGLSVGPDGRLYFTVGDSGVKGIQSRDGKGPKWVSNDKDVQKGTVWRCDLDGNNLELIAHNFRNNYEAAVDSFGEVWLSDNDDDGNQQTRVCFVMPGGNYGYGPRGPGQTHWHEEQPGIVHKVLRTGFGSPTGITFYEGSLLPKQYHGGLLHTDAGPRELRCFARRPKGAGYELDKTLMLTSTDNFFRPSDVCVAPDGSVFVADWYDRGVGGHGMGDPKDGRIYRITPTGHKGYKVPPVTPGTNEGLLAAIGSPNLATRALAVARSGVAPALPSFQEITDPVLKARVSAVVGRRSAADGGRASKWAALPAVLSLKDPDARLQAFGVREMRDLSRPLRTPGDVVAKVREMAGPSASAAVRRELLLWLRDTPVEHAAATFYAFAKQYDGRDHFYRAALNIAAGTDPARRDAILADFDKHFPEWNDAVADLVWELRPKSVLPRLDKLLADAKLSGPQKARVIDILAASDDASAGKSLLAVLSSDVAPEVKARALDNLRLFLPAKWEGLVHGEEVRTAARNLLGDPKTKVLGLQLAAASANNAFNDMVASIAADPKEPADARAEAVRALGKIRSPAAVAALVDLLKPAGPDTGADLSTEVVAALGSLITGQAKDKASQQALAGLQAVVTGKGQLVTLKRAAVAALAGTRAGTDWLLVLKEKNELPEAVAAETGRLLRNSPFQGQRNKALLLFPAPGKLDLKTLPPLAELAKRAGNADNGKAVMARSFTSEVQCLKCHTVRGQGGQIGPDLSMVGKKGSRENLFESILQPSKAVADQFVSWRIDTADGQTITGLIVAETDKAVTVRDANGKDYTIPTADIDRRAKSQVSLMPDNLAAALTEDELVDLVEYLTKLQTASLTPDSWQVAGPFKAGGGDMLATLNTEFGPEKGMFVPAAKFPGGAGAADGLVTWRTVRAGANGYYDLAALHGDAASNSATYAYREIEAPEAQDATVLIGTDDGGKLWVNGELVWSSDATRAAAPGQNTVPVKLRNGPNAVLLKVANGNSPHGFYLTITSGQELKAK